MNYTYTPTTQALRRIRTKYRQAITGPSWIKPHVQRILTRELSALTPNNTLELYRIEQMRGKIETLTNTKN